jgi:hypothetical protein
MLSSREKGLLQAGPDVCIGKSPSSPSLRSELLRWLLFPMAASAGGKVKGRQAPQCQGQPSFCRELDGAQAAGHVLPGPSPPDPSLRSLCTSKATQTSIKWEKVCSKASSNGIFFFLLIKALVDGSGGNEGTLKQKHKGKTLAFTKNIKGLTTAKPDKSLALNCKFYPEGSSWRALMAESEEPVLFPPRCLPAALHGQGQLTGKTL